jgi:uncharacterized iron-regulated protein
MTNKGKRILNHYTGTNDRKGSPMISFWLKWIERRRLAWALLGATEGIRYSFGSFLSIMRRFLFIIILFLPSAGHAFPNANERVIDYTLQVSSTVAVDISDLKTFADVMERVAGKKIVYVGENHNQYSHHVMELEIIKDLHRRGKKLAIGMEMFQRPFQKPLDDYIESRIDEREFLKKTQYFKWWGFDYNLYRPILELARTERIPVVALNMRQEIVDKVFRAGLDSLSEEEKKLVPSRMDFSDEVYRKRLEKVFREHENFGTENFNFFYQAQVLWDETMSESIDEFLKAHPSDYMVVLAGNGHLAYGSGIPKRTARRNGYDHAIILNDTDLEKDIADYVLFPKTIPGVTSPKLMVLLKEKEGKVEIAGFPSGSNSEKAGMKAGDMILSIDHAPVRDIDDVKIDLLFRNKGENVKVRILRKGFFGSKEIDFEVLLQ